MAKICKIYDEEVLWKDRKRILGLPISFTKYILTPTKLYTRKGLLNIREDRIELYRVMDFALKLPFGQRIFGCGTIEIHAKDKTCPTSFCHSIKRARKSMHIIEQAVNKERTRLSIQGRDMLGVAGAFTDTQDTQE